MEIHTGLQGYWAVVLCRLQDVVQGFGACRDAMSPAGFSATSWLIDAVEVSAFSMYSCLSRSSISQGLGLLLC